MAGARPFEGSQKVGCPNCGKTGWCFVCPNGTGTVCKRPGAGSWGYLVKTGIDKSDTPYELRMAEAPSAPDEGRPNVAAPATPVLPLASTAERDKVYRRFLHLCCLDPHHSLSLSQERGLSQELIRDLNFCSRPIGGRITHVMNSLKCYGDTLPKVPGFVPQGKGMGIAVKGAGLIIPHRDLAGDVVALQIRLDKAPEGDKYRWFSGGGGPSVPAVPYLAGNLRQRGGLVVLTEGWGKALAAASKYGALTIGLSGASMLSQALPILKEVGAREVLVAYDADHAERKPEDKPNQVFGWLRSAVKNLRAEGYTVRLLVWHQGPFIPGETPKGVDDAIRAGAELTELVGDQVDHHLQSVAESLGLSDRNQTADTSTEQADEGSGSSAFKRLLAIAEKRFTFFSDNGFGYLSPGNGRAISLASKAASDLLLLAAYEASGKPPASDTLTKVLDLKRAQVSLHGPARPVFRRVGHHDGRHYLDLCQDGKVVEITADGWKVIESPPDVFFLRTESQHDALPKPISGGDVLLLGQLVNAPEALLRLLIVWLVACLRTGFPYVILDIEGESGSGKSTAAKVLKFLIDPARSLSRGIPPTERDLAIASLNSHILSFDNIDRIKPEQSDQLCRCATGCANATRSHYTMTEETVIPMHSPVILTGIEGVVERADMASRVALVTLEPPAADKRLTEAELWPLAAELRPAILGGLLDAMVAGLRHLPDVKVEAAPRMVDFARFITAAERGLPWLDGEALQAFRSAQADLNEQALGKDRVALAVVQLLERRRSWEGTMSDLLVDLVPPSVGQDYWPTTAHALSRRVKQALPLLRARGIAMEERRRAGARSYLLTFSSSIKLGNSVTSVTDIREARGYGPEQMTLSEKIPSQSVISGAKASLAVTLANGLHSEVLAFEMEEREERRAFQAIAEDLPL